MANGSETDTPFVRLPQRAISDFTQLIKNRQHIRAIVEQSASELPAASIDAFSARVSAKTKIDAALVATVATALWNIKSLQRNLKVDNKRLVEIIGKSLTLQADEEWKTRYLKEWQETSETLSTALDSLADDHPLLISGKAHTLAYAHDHLLMASRVITDVRPVFDAAGERILETVITHTLAISYMDSGETRRAISFALDQRDVNELRKQCERAERKAKVVKSSLGCNPVILPEDAEQ